MKECNKSGCCFTLQFEVGTEKRKRGRSKTKNRKMEKTDKRPTAPSRKENRSKQK